MAPSPWPRDGETINEPENAAAITAKGICDPSRSACPPGGKPGTGRKKTPLLRNAPHHGATVAKCRTPVMSSDNH